MKINIDTRIRVGIKNTFTTVISNADGNYNLKFPKKGTAGVVTFCLIENKSMEKGWIRVTKYPMTIILAEDIQNLQYIVITGYQTMDERKMVVAVQVLKVENYIHYWINKVA